MTEARYPMKINISLLLLFCSFCANAEITAPAPQQPPVAEQHVQSYSSTLEEGEQIQIEFIDGQILLGTYGGETPKDSTHPPLLLLTLKDNESLKIPTSLIAQVRKERPIAHNESGKILTTDRALSRYFYSPSAFMLEKGRYSFAQKELLFSTVAYGLSDYLSVHIGSALPALFADGGENAILGIKAGGLQFNEFRFSIGWQGWMVADGLLNLPFLTMTYGNEKFNASINYGAAFNEKIKNYEDFYILGLYLRPFSSIALISESWILPELVGEGNFITSLGTRFIGQAMSLDVGFLFIPNVEIPIPWVGFNYTW